MAHAEGAVIVARRPSGRARAVWSLIRGHNGLIAAAGVAVGAWWVAGAVDAGALSWAAASAFCLASYANAFNDVRDVAIDRIAHPTRPLPGGALTAGEARVVWMASAVLAVVASARVTLVLALATAAVLGAMWAYSVWIKRTGAAGNVVVAVLASLPFLYGAAAAGRWRAGLGLVLAAAPLHLAREVAKDLDDATGDRGHRRTVPVVAGRGAALALIGLSVAAHVWGVLLLARGAERLLTFMVPAFAFLALGVGRAAMSRRGAPLLLKAAMLAAMVALVLTRGRMSLA